MTVTNFPGVTIPGPTFEEVTPGSISTGYFVGSELTRSSAHNIIFADITGNSHSAVKLPTDCEVGDVWEICFDTGAGNGLAIYAPDGETFGGAVDPVNGNAFGIGTSNPGAIVRKLTSTFWSRVS